jgi:hypothetical protein
MINDNINEDNVDVKIDLTASNSRLPRIKSQRNKQTSASNELRNLTNNYSFMDKDALGEYVKTEIDDGSSPKM